MARLTTIRPRVGMLNQQTARIPPKQTDSFYLSPEWRGVVADVRASRPAECQDCGRRKVRLFADHVVELRDGGDALDAGNIRLLCGSCHTRKTNAARAARQAARF